MIKSIVCITIVSCCCLIGYIKASSYKGRCIELQNVIEIIKLMDLDITYKKEPLSKSFKRLALSRRSWFSGVLNECSTKMNIGYSLPESWKTTINEKTNNCPLKSIDLDILNDFVMGLGKTDTEGQKKVFEPAMMRLQTNLREASLQEKKLGKMYISLGTAAGVIAVILLI